MLYGIILALATVQGVVLGALLFAYRRHNVRSNRILSCLLWLLAYILLAETLRVFGYVNVDSALYYIFLEPDWAIGPLLFLFVRSQVHTEFGWQKRLFWYFIPVLIQVSFSAFIKAQNLFWDGTRDSLTWLGYHGYRLWMHTPFLLILSSLLVLFFARKSVALLENSDSDRWSIIPSEASRLKKILYLYSGFAGIVILVSLIDYLFFDYAFNPFYVYPVFLGLAILTYWMALDGVLNRDRRLTRRKPTRDVELERLAQRLVSHLRNEKPFLDPALNAQKLAAQLAEKPYRISRALNQVHKQSVVQFINAHRVEEFQRRVHDPAFKHLTLLAIALDCGFNSKASANRIIKQITGKSPKEIRDEG